MIHCRAARYLDKHVYSGILPADSTLTSRDCVQLYQAKGDGCERWAYAGDSTGGV